MVIIMYNIEFADGVHVTIYGEEDMEVNSLSLTDVEFNNIASRAMTSETDYIRLCNAINNRLGVEVV